MKTIICLTDFSANAANAMKYAAALCDILKSKLILVHAYETPAMYAERALASIQLADEQIRLLTEKKLSDLKSQLQKKYNTIQVETILAEGASSGHLVEIADREKAELIVMGATATTQLERLLTGSTTDGVIQKANCPVLTVPKDARFKRIKKIIFSTDLHEDNIKAAISMSAFAKLFDAEIIFLYVDDKHLIHGDEDIVQMILKIRTRIRYPKISGYISKDTHIHEGINYFLKKHLADLLVMFTHSRHFPETLYCPSLTKTMSHQIKIPLLSMKFSDESILKNV